MRSNTSQGKLSREIFLDGVRDPLIYKGSSKDRWQQKEFIYSGKRAGIERGAGLLVRMEAGRLVGDPSWQSDCPVSQPMPATGRVIGIVSVTTVRWLPVVAAVPTCSNLKQDSIMANTGFEFVLIKFIPIDGEIGIIWCAGLNQTVQSIW